MSDPSKDVSRETLDRLIARAFELDEHRADRIRLTTAREIAAELGISEAAWDAAVAERTSKQRKVVTPEPREWGLRTMVTGGIGFAAGALGGFLNGAFNGDLDVAYGAMLVVAGITIAARRNEESSRAATASLDAWWLAVPVGLLVALGGIRTDPLLFAAFARWGTGRFTGILPTILHVVRGAKSHPSSSTA